MNMADQKQLRLEIIEKTKEYYQAKFAANPFLPGQSKMNYAGRVFDEQEIVNAVDASLDFWLTEGRFSEEFAEKMILLLEHSELAKKMGIRGKEYVRENFLITRQLNDYLTLLGRLSGVIN